MDGAAGILNLIWCWLQDFFWSWQDMAYGWWDALLGQADLLLAGLGNAGLTLPIIPDEYAWVLGATGMSQALSIIAGAMITRFTLQSIPFVRWGS